VALDISQHGGTKGQVSCYVPDNGSLVISAEMVTQLIDRGVAGFSTISITRKSVGSANIPQGRVDLLLISGTELPVEVQGYRSCNDNTDCEGGQTCSATLLCTS